MKIDEIKLRRILYQLSNRVAQFRIAEIKEARQKLSQEKFFQEVSEEEYLKLLSQSGSKVLRCDNPLAATLGFVRYQNLSDDVYELFAIGIEAVSEKTKVYLARPV